MNQLFYSLSIAAALSLISCGNNSTQSVSNSDSNVSNTKSDDPLMSRISKLWYSEKDIKSIDYSGDTLFVVNGTFHEAGSREAYKRVRDNKFYYLGFADWSNNIDYEYDYEPGDELKASESELSSFDAVQCDGYSVLVVDGQKTSFKDSLMVDNYIFAGEYKGQKTGKTYSIDIDNKNCQGFEKSSFYVLYTDDFGEEEYDDSFGDLLASFGSQYFNPRTMAIHNSDNQLVDILQRVYPTDKQTFPFTASTELDIKTLEFFSKDELKIMRNEIFARHGFIFSTDAMKKHFSAMSWYKPEQKNVDNLLSPVERHNVELIRKVENE